MKVSDDRSKSCWAKKSSDDDDGVWKRYSREGSTFRLKSIVLGPLPDKFLDFLTVRVSKRLNVRILVSLEVTPVGVVEMALGVWCLFVSTTMEAWWKKMGEILPPNKKSAPTTEKISNSDRKKTSQSQTSDVKLSRESTVQSPFTFHKHTNLMSQQR